MLLSYFRISGRLAAATDWPTRRVFSSGSMTWGLAKLAGVVLMTVALPIAGICAFLGLGLFLLLPVGLLLLALGLLRT